MEGNTKKEPTLHEIGALLEDMNGQLETVAEGVVSANQRLDRLDKRVEQLAKDVVALTAEVRGIRDVIGTPENPKIISVETYRRLEQRVAKLEDTLSTLQKSAA